MSRRWRLTIALIGLLILLFAGLALVYAYWPGSSLQEQVPIAPTLFIPP
jgi:hypothetical protein